MEFAPQCCGSGIFIPIPDPRKGQKIAGSATLLSSNYISYQRCSSTIFDHRAVRQGHTIEMYRSLVEKFRAIVDIIDLSDIFSIDLIETQKTKKKINLETFKAHLGFK
jgi:hypothetical protein